MKRTRRRRRRSDGGDNDEVGGADVAGSSSSSCARRTRRQSRPTTTSTRTTNTTKSAFAVSFLLASLLFGSFSSFSSSQQRQQQQQHRRCRFAAGNAGNGFPAAHAHAAFASSPPSSSFYSPAFFADRTRRSYRNGGFGDRNDMNERRRPQQRHLFSSASSSSSPSSSSSETASDVVAPPSASSSSSHLPLPSDENNDSNSSNNSKRKRYRYVSGLVDNLNAALDKWITTGSPVQKQRSYNLLEQIRQNCVPSSQSSQSPQSQSSSLLQPPRGGGGGGGDTSSSSADDEKEEEASDVEELLRELSRRAERMLKRAGLQPPPAERRQQHRVRQPQQDDGGGDSASAGNSNPPNPTSTTSTVSDGRTGTGTNDDGGSNELGRTDERRRREEAEQRRKWEESFRRGNDDDGAAVVARPPTGGTVGNKKNDATNIKSNLKRWAEQQESMMESSRSALSRRQPQDYSGGGGGGGPKESSTGTTNNKKKPDLLLGSIDPRLARVQDDKRAADEWRSEFPDDRQQQQQQSPSSSGEIEKASARVSELIARSGGGTAFHGETLGIGGLDEVLAQVKRRIWTPLAAPPRLLQELGIHPVRGLLLYGRPGCGKTLLASKLGQLLSPLRPITVVSGPEIMDKFVGSSEKNLRAVFDNPPDIYDFYRSAHTEEEADAVARAALHVVVMDEFDAIARSRGGRGGSGDGQGDAGVARDSVVNQLLAKMDGVDPLVVPTLVIGLTNKRSLIEPALLRPGRFEVQVEVPPPRTAQQRISILKVHTRDMHKAGRLLVRDAPEGSAAARRGRWSDELMSYQELLEWLAGQCAGFSGASIAGVCRAAASHALERAVEEFASDDASGVDGEVQAAVAAEGDNEAGGTHSLLDDCIVTESDFQEALQDVLESQGDSDWSEIEDESDNSDDDA